MRQTIKAFLHSSLMASFASASRTSNLVNELENWAEVGPVRVGFTLTAPEFAFVRADPRVKALRRKVRLPEQEETDRPSLQRLLMGSPSAPCQRPVL
jgi:hypothetical protein